jgi:hypothetical protein
MRHGRCLGEEGLMTIDFGMDGLNFIVDTPSPGWSVGRRFKNKRIWVEILVHVRSLDLTVDLRSCAPEQIAAF